MGVKVVCFRRDGREALGVLDAEAEKVHPVVGRPPGPRGVVALIEQQASGSPVETTAEVVDLASVELLAPVPRPPRNVFCVGKNYWDHSAEFAGSGYDKSATGGDDVPDLPIVFTKPASSVVGPQAIIEPHTHLTRSLDYEVELAVIIGRGGRGIAADDVWQHVWGYTLVNDVTARDLQRNHKQWFIGKSLDTFCPMGPWAVTADEVDQADTMVEAWVNGERRQHANTRDFIFDIPTVVTTLSAGMTLEPGDVIATGTPAGVGIGFDPPRFLQPGDEVTVSATGVGELTNRVSERTQ